MFSRVVVQGQLHPLTMNGKAVVFGDLVVGRRYSIDLETGKVKPLAKSLDCL
jgi:hypothetical protein